MNRKLRHDAEVIIRQAIDAVKPDFAVKKALASCAFSERVFLVAAGKAGWKMARAAQETLGDQLTGGVVVTKYGHAEHPLPGIQCYEGGHPVPD